MRESSGLSALTFMEITQKNKESEIILQILLSYYVDLFSLNFGTTWQSAFMNIVYLQRPGIYEYCRISATEHKHFFGSMLQ